MSRTARAAALCAVGGCVFGGVSKVFALVLGPIGTAGRANWLRCRPTATIAAAIMHLYRHGRVFPYADAALKEWTPLATVPDRWVRTPPDGRGLRRKPGLWANSSAGGERRLSFVPEAGGGAVYRHSARTARSSWALRPSCVDSRSPGRTARSLLSREPKRSSVGSGAFNTRS